MPKATTRKAKKVLNVQKKSDIPKLKKVMKKEDILVVMVLAPWCGACKKKKPDIMKSLLTPTKYPRVVVDSDVANNVPELKNAVTRYPSFLVLKNGSPIEQEGPEGITKEVQTNPTTVDEFIDLGNNPPSRSKPNTNTTVPVSTFSPMTMNVNKTRNTRRLNQSPIKNATPTEIPPNTNIESKTRLTEEPLTKK
jgi:thiol-disulfide isomerase/thioredoxin